MLTRFLNEGKATIQFKEPPHDLYIQSEAVQLKSFLHLLRRILENKVTENERTFSSMAVTPVASKNIPQTELTIRNRSEYPIRGFPRTLEVLKIIEIGRCSLDKGILQLKKLRVLNLSHNCIRELPEALNELPALAELDLSFNEFNKCHPKRWSWMGGGLSKTLKLLNLSSNCLKILPNQLNKLHELITLNVDNNELELLPSCIGNLRKLRTLTASNNSLRVLPGSAKNWRLNSLDLSNNNLDPDRDNNPAAETPKPLPVLSLKEYAGRKVLQIQAPYSKETIPVTLVVYLDDAEYCVCGNALFGASLRHTFMLPLGSVADIYTVSNTTLVYAPIDCRFCSLACFRSNNYNRIRNPVI